MQRQLEQIIVAATLAFLLGCTQGSVSCCR